MGSKPLSFANFLSRSARALDIMGPAKPHELAKALRRSPKYEEASYVDLVSVKEPVELGDGKLCIGLVDCGVKRSIVRELLKRGVRLRIVPCRRPELAYDCDGLFVSNGPGNPKLLTFLAEEIRQYVEYRKPLMGICLGHQVVAMVALAYDVVREEERALIKAAASLGVGLRLVEIGDVLVLDAWEPDVYLVRTLSHNKGIIFASAVESRGGVAVNSSAALATSWNKALTLTKLLAAGLPVPKSFVLFGKAPLDVEGRKIVKAVSGSWGRKVSLVTSREELEVLLKSAEGEVLLLQEAVGTGEDIRVFVIGDRAVAAMVIPRDAKNVDAAYAFIDFVLRPENAARITLASYYPTAVKKQLVAKYLPADVLEDPAVYPPEGANLIYLNYTKELLDAVERIRAAVR